MLPIELKADDQTLPIELKEESLPKVDDEGCDKILLEGASLHDQHLDDCAYFKVLGEEFSDALYSLALTEEETKKHAKYYCDLKSQIVNLYENKDKCFENFVERDMKLQKQDDTPTTVMFTKKKSRRAKQLNLKYKKTPAPDVVATVAAPQTSAMLTKTEVKARAQQLKI